MAVTSLGRGGPNGERMGLGVEDVLVEAEELQVVGEEQVQVLQRLAQEEALHLVPRPGVDGVADVVDGRVAAAGHLHKRKGREGTRLYCNQWRQTLKCHVASQPSIAALYTVFTLK